MRDAGYAESTALSKQSEKVGKLAVPIQGLMERMGITDELLLQVLAEGLQATKRIYLRNWRRRKEEVSTLKNELCNAVTRTKKG